MPQDYYDFIPGNEKHLPKYARQLEQGGEYRDFVPGKRDGAVAVQEPEPAALIIPVELRTALAEHDAALCSYNV
jgi:hypothetical protein